MLTTEFKSYISCGTNQNHTRADEYCTHSNSINTENLNILFEFNIHTVFTSNVIK